MGRSRYKVLNNQYPYFLTCTVVNWIPVFNKPEIVELLFNSLIFMQDHKRLFVHAYVVMENHMHLICSSNELSKEIGKFKRYTARIIIDHLCEQGRSRILRQLAYYRLRHRKDRKYQFWQESSHPVECYNENVFKSRFDYIHNNPVECGYVDEPWHWRYSSARNVWGYEAMMDIVRLDAAL